MIGKKEQAARSILLVEDEEALAEGIEYNLVSEGYEVTRARDGREALEILRTREFDLIILDIMLPYIDGFEVTRRVREFSTQVPILILTARTSQEDRIRGLETGADDFLTKPFTLRELLLRIGGMLKRKGWYRDLEGSRSMLRVGDAEIDFTHLSVRTVSGSFQLTPLEASLLRYLMDHPGRVIERSELLRNVWNLGQDVSTRTVDNFIMRLRRILEPDPLNPVHITSVRGAGYVFNQRA